MRSRRPRGYGQRICDDFGRPTTLLTLSVLILASACLAPGAMAADRIYWTTPYGANKIYVAKLDGSDTVPAEVNLTGATVNTPWGAALDPAAGKIYWANYLATRFRSRTSQVAAAETSLREPRR